MEETRQNPGGNVDGSVTAPPEAAAETPEDALERVLDAWSAESSSRQRFDRLRLERRDGKSLDVLVDAETARDLGDKLTIMAARARYRARGAAGVPVAGKGEPDPGRLEDIARARKVLDLIAGGTPNDDPGVDVAILAEEFCASRENVEKAYAMIDEQRAKHLRDMAAIAERHVQAAKELESAQAELASVKADRDRLIAEAARADAGVSTIDLSDPSEPAPG